MISAEIHFFFSNMVLEITGDGKVTPRKGKEGRIFPKQSMNCEPNQDDINWLQGSKRASMWLRRKTKTGEYVAPEENQNGRVCGSGRKPKPGGIHTGTGSVIKGQERSNFDFVRSRSTGGRQLLETRLKSKEFLTHIIIQCFSFSCFYIAL